MDTAIRIASIKRGILPIFSKNDLDPSVIDSLIPGKSL